MIELDDLRLVRGGRLVLYPGTPGSPRAGCWAYWGRTGRANPPCWRPWPGAAPRRRAGARSAARPIQGWRPPELARHRAVLPQASQLGLPLSVTEVVALGRIPWAGIEDQEQHWDAIAEGLAVASAAHLAHAGPMARCRAGSSSGCNWRACWRSCATRPRVRRR